MTLLKATNLSHSFDYKLFGEVSLELREGESISIIGSSGSGKSTLLHILCALLSPDGGSVELFDKEISSLSSKELLTIRRDKIGLVFQSHYLFKGFSAYENLEVASILSSQSIDEELLRDLGIDAVMSKKVTQLSGGQQQRVSIARVLTKKPKILFLDEPTGNLDKNTANEVMEIFFRYVQNYQAGMILVTHDEELAFRCKHVFRLEDQRLKKLV
ncbi:MAG: ABC transporter ATP-binding protein [Sulfuricurvum sp.]|jgi:putative ABC transport system ATP-binding protein